MRTPVQWNCECCPNSGLLAPPQKPVYVQDGERDVPDADKNGKPIWELIDGKDNKGKPIKIRQMKTKKVPIMINPKIKSKRQDPITGKVHPIDVPQMEDLTERIYMAQVRVGEESVTRYLCKQCLDKILPLLKTVKDKLEGMNP